MMYLKEKKLDKIDMGFALQDRAIGTSVLWMRLEKYVHPW